jgi:hypothetical protein
MDEPLRAHDGWSNHTGLPAIHPHLLSVPAFTEEDVRTFITEHPLPGGSIRSVGQPTITKILFMTTSEASELIHSFISQRNHDLVCYVELKGYFTFHGGPPGSVNTTPASEEQVFEVFDAQTGDCLVVGFVTR